MFGSGYVLDHVVLEYNRRETEELFRSYVSDLAKCLVETWGGEVPYRYSDLLEYKEEPQKTGDEIALEVIRKLGLKGKHNGLHEIEGESGTRL